MFTKRAVVSRVLVSGVSLGTVEVSGVEVGAGPGSIDGTSASKESQYEVLVKGVPAGTSC